MTKKSAPVRITDEPSLLPINRAPEIPVNVAPPEAHFHDLSSVLLTSEEHTVDLLEHVPSSTPEPSGHHIRAFDAGFSFRSGETSPAVYSVNRRRSRRFRAGRGDVIRRRGRGRPKPVADVSVWGVGLEDKWSGSPRAEVELTVADQVFRGSTEQVRPSGLKFFPEDDPLRLARTLLRHRDGPWRFRGELSRQQVTELFESSGYLGLRDGTSLTSDWLNGPSQDISVDMVWMEEGPAPRPIAHVSSSRMYSKTWVTHQLATSLEHPARHDARLDCYRLLSALPTMVDPEAMKLAYFDRSKHWHRVLCENFVRWMNDPRHAAMVAWDRWEIASDAVEPRLFWEPRISVLDETGRRWLQDHLRARLPALARRALDLEAGDPVSDSLHPAFRSNNVERRREGWMAKENGGVAGVALLEVSDPSLSIFNLFNLSQLFFEPEASPELRASMMKCVVERYSELGIGRPILVSLPGALAGCDSARYRFTETMGMMTWSATGLRQYENFINYSFGRHRRRHKDSESKR